MSRIPKVNFDKCLKPITLLLLFAVLTAVFTLILPVVVSCSKPKESPLKIVIYTDFNCSACAKFHEQVEPELRRRYVSAGKCIIEVRLLALLDAASERAAEAALCAEDQGKFLEYQDALFAIWDTGDATLYSTESLLNLAEMLGLDVVTFKSTYESGSKQIELDSNRNLAQEDGLVALPMVVIGATKIQGIKQLDTYVQLIEQALSK